MKLLNNVKLLILCALALCFSFGHGDLCAGEMLSIGELEVLSEMLNTEGFSLEHTAFYRDWDPDTVGKSDWHLQVLSSGLKSLPLLDDLRAKMQARTESELPRYLGSIAKESPFYRLELPNPRLNSAGDLFAYVELCYRFINRMYEQSFAALSPAAQDSLAAFLMQVMIEQEDHERYRGYFADHQLPWLEEMDIEAFARLILKMDMASLIAATEAMLQLRDTVATFEPVNDKVLVHKSEFGLMIIGSAKHDVYSAENFPQLAEYPVCLILDPAGNDIYDIPLYTSRINPLMLLIDKAGSDIYRSREPSFFARQGLFFGMDIAGDDVYQLADFSFSALMGCMWHLDKAGDDIYQSGIFSQAAAILGIAYLRDDAGDDNYSAHALAQAFGSTFGTAVLADYSGSDRYYLGGKYFHAPLMPNDYRTMGQGMGYGIRPYLAGGLGLLHDAQGNDKYLGGVYAQGVGYWYATGILMDEAGNDVYNAIYYPQGSGIHLASGILYDGAGNDCYYSRNGPGQGAGHDYGFGLFIDGGGDDAYSIHGGNGLGLSNSLGIFVDSSGNDRYERSEAQNYGHANFSRSTGGLGLFLDAGGVDSYPDSTKANNTQWQKGTYGFGKDMELNIIEKPEPEKDEEQLAAPAADAPIAEIFAAASEWEVGNAVSRVRTARQYMLERAAEARSYIAEHKLANKSGLEYRALQALCKQDTEFREILLGHTANPDSMKAKTAISLLAGERDNRILPQLAQHLAEARYTASCIAALGNLDAPESLQLLLQQKDQPNERLRFLVARSISMHKSAEAKLALEEFHDDPSFLIQALIRNLPKENT
jgi:hypothetical protein